MTETVVDGNDAVSADSAAAADLRSASPIAEMLLLAEMESGICRKSRLLMNSLQRPRQRIGAVQWPLDNTSTVAASVQSSTWRESDELIVLQLVINAHQSKREYLTSFCTFPDSIGDRFCTVAE